MTSGTATALRWSSRPPANRTETTQPARRNRSAEGPSQFHPVNPVPGVRFFMISSDKSEEEPHSARGRKPTHEGKPRKQRNNQTRALEKKPLRSFYHGGSQRHPQVADQSGQGRHCTESKRNAVWAVHAVCQINCPGQEGASPNQNIKELSCVSSQRPPGDPHLPMSFFKEKPLSLALSKTEQ